MKIWYLLHDTNYEQLESVRDMPVEELRSFDGRSKIKNWKPLMVRPLIGKYPFADVSSVWYIPAISPKVVDLTKDLIEGQVEYLPTICVNHEYYMLNVINVVDAIDYSKAKAKFFSNSNRVMRFEKFAFYEEKLRGNHIFQLVEYPMSSIYVSDEFRQRIIDNGIKGFYFELVWDSEA